MRRELAEELGLGPRTRVHTLGPVAVEAARAGQARLFVVREEGDAGKRLRAFGGIGALLRYDWVSPSRATGSPGSLPGSPRSGA